MRKACLLLLIPLLWSCGENSKEVVSAEVEQIAPWKSSINELMDLQEQAWNDGNLEEFMAPYLQSDSMMFIGKRGLSYGWQTTLDNYKKGYPNKEAMGQLEFENLNYQQLGEKNALIIGRWHLYRTADTLSGSYSLNWQWINGQWRIIADHSS